MKATLRKIFAPVLNNFESTDNKYAYKPSHRKILIIVGALFLMLSMFGAFISLIAAQPGGLIPSIVFFVVGFVCEVVGLLGTDTAVANIWKSR